MKIILTAHAKKRMAERGIKPEEVNDVVEFPDYTINKENKIELYKKINNRTIKIVALSEGKFIKIITLITK